jgi:hypothetical protein
MSTIGVIALVVAVVWLTGLSFVLVLLVRQLDLLRSWAVEQSVTPTDGLEVGADVPGAFAELGVEPQSGPAYLLFLGGNCQPCREFALEARNSDRLAGMADHYPIVAAVTGSDTQAADLAGVLPGWFSTIDGRAATTLMRGFEVVQTPSIFEIERGKVTGRAVAGYGLTNFLNLVDAREVSDAAKFAGAVKPGAGDLQMIVKASRKASP